jgi:hypothetical protein
VVRSHGAPSQVPCTPNKKKKQIFLPFKKLFPFSIGTLLSKTVVEIAAIIKEK